MRPMHSETVGPTDAGADDAPDLVLLHGGIGTGRYHWQKSIDGLSGRYRLHLPDLPGHGGTPPPRDGTYDREVLVAAVEALIDELGPPVHVAGFSMGGHTALALAARRPEAFASLVLIGVSHREHEGLHAWRRTFVPDAFAEKYPLWRRQLAKLHAPLGGDDAWRGVLERDSSGLDVDVPLDELAALQCPVLLVRGDRDTTVQPEQYAELRAIWEQADELVVPAGAHDVQLTRAAIVQPALEDFFARVAKGA